MCRSCKSLCRNVLLQRKTQVATRKHKTCFKALRHEIFCVLAAFVVDIFQVLGVISKSAQQRHILKVDILYGAVNE